MVGGMGHDVHMSTFHALFPCAEVSDSGGARSGFRETIHSMDLDWPTLLPLAFSRRRHVG